MIGLTGATLSAACFGFSRSLSTMLIARALAGGLSGNVAVVSSMLSEMTDETNQGMGTLCSIQARLGGFAIFGCLLAFALVPLELIQSND